MASQVTPPGLIVAHWTVAGVPVAVHAWTACEWDALALGEKPAGAWSLANGVRVTIRVEVDPSPAWHATA